MNRTQKKFFLLIMLIAYIYDLKRNRPVQYFIFRHTVGDNHTSLNTIFDRIIDNSNRPLLDNDMIPVRSRIENLLSWSRTFQQF
jgi:hypothetical protein